MTTANEEFADLMPHLIKVTGKPTYYDDHGKPVNVNNVRTYRCLFDDATTTVRDATGTTVTVSATLYIAPVPLESTDGEPVDIEADEKVEILSPRVQTRPLVGIERHYDSENGVGKLHNIVMRLS